MNQIEFHVPGIDLDFTATDLTYDRSGDDLLVNFGIYGQILIVDQFHPSWTAGIDRIVLANGMGETIDLLAMFVPEPTAALLAAIWLATLCVRRQRGADRGR